MYQITCITNNATPPSLFKSWSSLMPMSHPRRTLKQSAETIAHSHPTVNRVACPIAAESYYVVFYWRRSAARAFCHKNKEACCPRKMLARHGKFYIRSRWLLAITRQPWSKRRSKLHLNIPILKASKEETHEIWVLVAKASKRDMVMNS